MFMQFPVQENASIVGVPDRSLSEIKNFIHDLLMQTNIVFREVYAWEEILTEWSAIFHLTHPPGIEGMLKQFIHVLCLLSLN